MGDGSFAPEQSVTRQQLLVMLHSFARQYLKLEPTGAADLSIYGDGGQVADWARDAVSWAVSAGLIVPSGEGTLRPGGPGQPGRGGGHPDEIQQPLSVTLFRL